MADRRLPGRPKSMSRGSRSEVLDLVVAICIVLFLVRNRMGRCRVANAGTVEAVGCSRVRETFRRISKDLPLTPFLEKAKGGRGG